MLDMTQLKRIDFEKCKLANLDDVPLAIELSSVSIRIVSAETGTVILFREFDNEWETDDGSILSNKAQIDEIFARGATVDAFIERELRLIYAIENPPTPGDGYELCTAEQAKSDCDAEYKFIRRSTNAWYREWQKVSGCIWGDEETYVFRRPIAKPIIAPPLPGEGYELCDRENATEWNYTSRTYGGKWDECWSPISQYDSPNGFGVYAFRRPIEKPKTVTVEIPSDIPLCGITVVYGGKQFRIESYSRGHASQRLDVSMKEIS